MEINFPDDGRSVENDEFKKLAAGMLRRYYAVTRFDIVQGPRVVDPRKPRPEVIAAAIDGSEIPAECSGRRNASATPFRVMYRRT